MPEIGFLEAITTALAEEMARDPNVFIMGEDVKLGAFGATRGLVDRFGPARVRNTPISEAGIAGAGIGAAMAGMRPIVEIEFASFFYCCWDQVCNQAAKLRYMSGGQARLPLTFRCVYGAMGSAAAQHSEVVYSQFLAAPGVKIVIPSGAAEMKGLLKAAIRDDSPVVFFEDKMGYAIKGEVPEGDFVLPLGVADVKRVGEDITIVAISSMVLVALEAAELLAAEGLSAEVVNPRTTVPLDVEAIVRSAKKTSRAIVLDEGYQRYGVTAEIAAVISDGAFFYLDAPVKRMGAMDVPVPFSPVLEDLTVPTAATVAAEARRLCRK